jgi:hypothetical protein
VLLANRKIKQTCDSWSVFLVFVIPGLLIMSTMYDLLHYDVCIIYYMMFVCLHACAD